MHKHTLLYLSSLLVLAPQSHLLLQANTSSLIAESGVESYEQLSIAKMEVIVEDLPANISFEPKTILNKLKTREKDPFSQTVFDEDLKSLSEEYDRVEPILEVHNGQLYITLKIWLRPTIRTIEWEGNTHIKTSTLQKELGIKPGSIFNRQMFNQSFHKVKEYYIKKGYFESLLQYKTIVDPKTNEIDISIHVTEGRSGKIENLTFQGFTSTEESQLLDMIHTKKYSLLLSWITGNGVYREEALEQDQLTIVNFLQNQGYADAKVKISIEESSKEGRIIISIDADRGELYHFGKITFNGNTIFSDEDVERQFITRPGDVYSPENLRLTAQNIRDLCGRKGYIEANVQYETKLVSDQPIYNVEFWIEEGDQYKIGLIHVLGNTNTKTHVILRESLLIPGETFDSAKLKATQQKLESIGYFKNVNVYAVRTQDDILLGENYRDVYIEVEETTTGSASIFFGYSSADSGFGGLDLMESNFNYAGIPHVFTKGLSALRGGGEFLRGRASFGPKQQSYTLSWMTPYYRDTLWRVGVDGTFSKSDLQSKDYHTNTIGGSAYASYPLNSLWTFGSKYRIKQTLTHVSSNASSQEKRQAGHSGLLSAVSSSFTFDSTDSAFKPRHGFRSFIEGEFAGAGGNICFIRLGYINSYYTPLWKYGTMKYRFDLRFLNPVLKTKNPDDIFMSERFFAGGENSVRGYKAFSLGSYFKNTTDPKGGISSSLFSIEYLQYVVKMADLFLFADAGTISMSRFNIPTLRLSYGFGARIDLLNRVPLVLGMGFPVNLAHKKQEDRFFFSMGGQF